MLSGGRSDAFVDLERALILFEHLARHDVTTPLNLLLHARDQPLGFNSPRPQRLTSDIEIPRRRVRETQTPSRALLETSPSHPSAARGPVLRGNFIRECAPG